MPICSSSLAQARLAIALAGLVNREIGLQRLEVLLSAYQAGGRLADAGVGGLERDLRIGLRRPGSFGRGDFDRELVAHRRQAVWVLGRLAGGGLPGRQGSLAFLGGQSIEQALQSREIGFQRGVLLAKPGDALAHDGQAAFGDAGLLPKIFAARTKEGEAFVDCPDALVETAQGLLARQGVALCQLSRDGCFDEVFAGPPSIGVRTRQARPKETHQQLVQLHPKRFGAFGAIGLAFEAPDVGRQLGQHILDADKIRLGRGQLGAGLVQPKLMAADVGDVFEDDAAFVGSLQDQFVDRSLADDRVAVRTQPSVQQQLGDVLKPHARAIEQVLAVSRAVQPAGDAHFGILDRQAAVGVVEDERDLGHAQRLPRRRAREDHLLRLARPDRLRRLLAEHPQHAIGNIGLAGTVRADDDDDAGQELGRSASREGLEADELEALQEQGRGQTRVVYQHWEQSLRPRGVAATAI